MLSRWDDDEYREFIRVSQENSWIGTDRSEKQSSSMLLRWSDSEYKERVKATMRVAAKDPLKLAKIAEAGRKSWATPERRIKQCFTKRRGGRVPSFEDGWKLVLSKGFLPCDWYSFALDYYSTKYPPSPVMHTEPAVH